jgi:hypothetical protein
MNWVERIQYYYSKGLWNKERVKNVVGKVITPEEYEQITGEEYNEDVVWPELPS